MSMEDIISADVVKNLMEKEGKTRGVALKNHREFILKEKGPEGLKIFEDAMANVGYPLKHKDLQEMSFYPIGLEIVELLVIKKLFNFDDKKIEEMGAFEARLSLVMKIFFKYFVSVKLLAQQAPEMWTKSYTIGDFKVKEWSEKDKYAIITIENFNLHPVHCIQMGGYISSIVKMVARGNVSCQETKCIHKGDDHHEFLLKW